MSTIFKCQEDIKNYFPTVKNVRIYPSLDSKCGMTVYYENINSSFDDSLIPKMKDILPAHISFNFKPYSKLKDDNVPPAPKVPELIQNLALKSTGNLNSFKDVLQKALPELNPIIDIPAIKPNETIIITIRTEKKLLPEDMNRYIIYAQEIVPIGCKIRLVSWDY